MRRKDADEVRKAVRESYAGIAQRGGTSCCSPRRSCCAEPATAAQARSARLGYSASELEGVPEGADMGLGCGNPQAIAALRKGEVVLDLGSGGGFDCFLAAKRVGKAGRVIGVDMTPEMVSKARENARKAGCRNVDFRLGEIEHLPAADNSVDVIISNCVINLSPDKVGVYREAFRVLRPGGRIAIFDVVATRELPDDLRKDTDLLSGCISGAVTIRKLQGILRKAGFAEIRIEPKQASREYIKEWAPGRGIEDYIVSAAIEAAKPG